MENQEKARPLKITVSLETEKAIILIRNVLKLREQENPEDCHGNFVPLKILVQDQFFQKKSFHPEQIFLKKKGQF